MDLFAASSSWTHTSTAQRLVAGPGSLDEVASILREAGARRALLITSERRLASDAGQQLTKRLGRLMAGVYAGAAAHVPVPVVQEAVGRCRELDADAIVSFGGGSANDLGKAVAFFTEQAAGTPASSFLDRPVLPHVAIPTTWSGAELTGFFGMTDPSTRRKQGAGGPTCAPIAAIYDPAAVSGLDAVTSAGSGMNCLAHGIEAAWSTRRTPEAHAIALACISRTVDALPAAVEDPWDTDALSAMGTAAALGGRALQNAGMGVHHGLAQLLGGRSGVSHGLANALLLAHTVAFNAADPLLANDLHHIGVALGDPDDPACAVDRLRDRLGLPARLGDVGVSADDLEAVAKQAPAHQAVRANPRPVDESDARAILEAAF